MRMRIGFDCLRRTGLAAALTLIVAACAGPAPPLAPGASVLLLSVDSLRCDRLQCFNPEASAHTPNLDRLAAGGTVFTNAWSTAPWTAPSMVSVFTGLYPPAHGVVHRDDTTPSKLPSMPRLLEAQDYRLGNFAFFSAISYFRNLGLPAPAPRLGHGHATAAFARWIDPEQPFFAWIHLVEPHLPYGASGYQSNQVRVAGSTGLEMAQLQGELAVGSAAFATGDRQRLLSLYDGDLEAMDKRLGEILDALRRSDTLRNTLIVLVADHGEELLDHGWVGHASTAREARMVPEVLRVPLIISGPGIPTGQRRHALVQQVEILPTVCRLLGLPTPVNVDGKAIDLRPDTDSSARELAFFDSSAGGNLTPVTRRDERVQAVTDGSCLLTAHSADGQIQYQLEPVASGTCTERIQGRLLHRLQRWQKEQAAQRITILRGFESEAAPDPQSVAACEPTLQVRRPLPGQVLRWNDHLGQIVIEWPPQAGDCWIDYQVGVGIAHLQGIFKAESDIMVFGPFPVGFWNDLARHNPYRFRVICSKAGFCSDWVDFTLEEQ